MHYFGAIYVWKFIILREIYERKNTFIFDYHFQQAHTIDKDGKNGQNDEMDQVTALYAYLEPKALSGKKSEENSEKALLYNNVKNIYIYYKIKS